MLLAAALVFQWIACVTAGRSPSTPSLVLSVLQDDWGFATASFNRRSDDPPLPEQRTPRLDALAAQGVILDRHYAHAFCSPTRASFLSGRLPVHVQTNNVQPDMPNAGIPAAMTTLPEKLASMGFTSHVAGKWDVGMQTRNHTPEGRGFNSSLIFFSHAIDAFAQNDVDGLCGQKFVDFWDSGAPARQLNGTGYFDELVVQRLLDVIAKHDFAAAPLYIHWTPHVTHNPLQAPAAFYNALNGTVASENLCKFSVNECATGAVYPGGPTDTSVDCRRAFEAMAAFADYSTGRIVDAIAARGVWNESLIVWQSDNGGQADLRYGGGSNFPLRGSKGSWWEGGFRVAAMVSGGFLPPAVRGSHISAMTHTADWLLTLCLIAGGSSGFCSNDTRADAAGYPAVDSLNLWPLLTGENATSPRTGFPASSSTMVRGPFKLLLGDVTDASWMGPLWPNSSSPSRDIQNYTAHCGKGGCLYNVEEDPTEQNDIAAENPAVVAELLAELHVAAQSFWNNNESGVCAHNSSLPIQSACACDAASVVWGGFLGPYARA